MERFCFVLFFLGLSLLSHATIWTLSREILEEKLPIEVSIEELVRVLNAEGVEVRFKTHENLILWKEDRASISLAASPFASYHLWIEIEGRKTLDECTADELAELYTAIWKARKALRETIGAESFMIFTTEGMRNGKGSSWVGVEIIPSGFYGSDIMDAVEKIALNQYIFYNRFPARSISHSPETLAAIQEKLQILQPVLQPVLEPVLQSENLKSPEPEKLLHHERVLYENRRATHSILAQMGAFITDAVEKIALNQDVFYNRVPARSVAPPPETLDAIPEKPQILEPENPQSPWSQKLLHHERALYEDLQTTHSILAQMGVLIEGEMPSFTSLEENVHEIQINLDRCAFCNPKVIEQQLICDWKEIQILLNHKPVSFYGNFLILPKKHQCAWDLTQEEAIASFEAVIALKKTFLEKTGLNNWICYIQDGPAVGQTVPHTHIHFYIIPDPLKTSITCMQHIHNQRSILSYEEIRANAEKIKPHLLKHLQNREVKVLSN